MLRWRSLGNFVEILLILLEIVVFPLRPVINHRAKLQHP